MAAYVKPVLLILGSGSIAYALLLATTPNESYENKVKKVTAPESSNQVVSQKQQLFNVLQGVSSSKKPLHLLTKKELQELTKEPRQD